MLTRGRSGAAVLLLAGLLTACGGEPELTTAGDGGADGAADTRPEAGSSRSPDGVTTETGRRDHDGPVSRLVVEVDAGDLDVRPGGGEGAVVTRTVRWRGAAPVVTEQVEGDTLRITADCPDRSSRDDRCEVHLAVTVPAASSVDAALGAGDVTVEGLAGEQVLVTSAGDVAATALQARSVRAESSAGDVEVVLFTAPGSVDARSAAGDVRVVVPGNRAYRVDAATGAGDVEVTVERDPASDATVRARSSAGDVTVENR